MNARVSRRRETKACNTCAKAKVKCETEFRKDRCKRCHRLDKICENQMPGAHSNKKLLESRYSKEDFLRLESKVDSVSHLLASTAHSNRTSKSASPLPNPQTGINPVTCLPSSEEAAVLLQLFQDEMIPLFPFITIPLDTTPDQLRHEKPLLFMVVMMVASQSDVSRQLELAQLIRSDFSQAVLVRGEKSLGLLQALLVYIAWNHVHLQLGHQLFNFLHLAFAMLTDLGLNKEPHSHSRTAAGAFREVVGDRISETARTLEERRALLGVFWLSSILKMCFKDIDAMRFTRTMEQCCQILEDTQDQPSDIYLVQSARLQQVAIKIGQILYSDEIDMTSGMSVPLVGSISSLEKQILKARSSLRLDIPQASLLLISFEMLRLYFYKIGLDDGLFHTSLSNPSPTFTTLHNHLLVSCVDAIKMIFNLFLQLPIQTIFALPYSTWGQIGHATLMLWRLSEAKNDMWDPTYLYSMVNMREMYKKLAYRLEEVRNHGARQTPTRSLPEVFNQMAAKMKDLGEVGRKGAETRVVNDINTAFEEEMMNDIFFEFFDFSQAIQ